MAVAVIACHFDQAIAASSQDIAKARIVSAFLAQAAACKLPTEGLVRSYWAWFDKTFPNASADRAEWLPQLIQAAQRSVAENGTGRRSCAALASARQSDTIMKTLQQSDRSIDVMPPVSPGAKEIVGIRERLRAAPSVGAAAQPAKSATANRAQPKTRSLRVEPAWWNRTPVANR
jgi:hypothetical protein